MKKSHHTMIVGTLYSNSRTIYGATPKGVPIFKFIPMDRNLSEMRVATRKRGNMAVRAIVKVVGEKTELVEILGPVGDPQAEYTAILVRRDLPRGNLKPPIRGCKPSRCDSAVEDLRNLETMTIDPKGCKDADDAFSLDGDTVWVHITDASSEVPLQSDIHPVNTGRWSSVYLPDRIIHMLPKTMSEGSLSLQEGSDRYCISIKYPKNGEPSLHRTLIHISRNLSYEDEDDDMIQKMLRLSETRDTHALVEYWMVRSNEYVARVLGETFPDEMIHRVHPPCPNNRPVNLLPEFFQNFSAFYQNQRGEHSGLSLDHYTHFTSPIRRGIDMLIHHLCHCYLDGIWNVPGWRVDNWIKAANEWHNRVKKADRDVKRYQIVCLLDTLEEISATGIVISLDPPKVYLPKYEFINKLTLFSSKIADRCQIHRDQNRLTVTTPSLNNHQNIIVLEMYREIDLTLVADSTNPYHRVMIKYKSPET